MKISVDEISPADVGCVCVLYWTGQAFGFTGHSQRHGLEGSGKVSCPVTLVGRLCDVSEDQLVFLSAWRRTHPMGLSWSTGPRSSMEYDVVTVDKKNINRPVYINFAEGSNAIRQHFQAHDRKHGIWKVWPVLKRHWNEI